MKEGDIMQTMRGNKVRIIDLNPAFAPKERISVFDIENKFCFYIHPSSLRPL
jgi:hypothetical protein